MTTIAADRRSAAAPSRSCSSMMQIEPQWIDYNGHLNMAYYNVMFDRAIDEMWLQLGIGPGYMKERQRLDLHRRMPCAVSARNPPRRSRAGVVLAARSRRQAPAYVRGAAARDRRLAVGDLREHVAARRHGRAKGRAVSARHPRPHRSRRRRPCALPRPEGIGRNVAMPSKIAHDPERRSDQHRSDCASAAERRPRPRPGTARPR